MSSLTSFTLPTPPTDSVQIRIRVRPKDIIDIHGIMEAYDHFAVVRTIDNRKGILELLASPSFLNDLNRLLKALVREMPLEILTPEMP